MFGVPQIPINRMSLREMAVQAGMGQYLQLCLDPACNESYPGSGQTFFDISGNGRHFYLGDTSSASAVDPIFNGTSGSLDSSNYFSSTGGMGFISVNATDTFFNSMHKVGWEYTIVLLDYYTSGYGAGFNTKSGNLNQSGVGVSTYIGSSSLGILIGNGGSSISTFPTAAVPTSQVWMGALGAQYLSSTNRWSVSFLAGTFTSVTNTGSFTPSSSDGITARIGLTDNGSSFLSTGRRLYGFLIFNKVMTQVDLEALQTQVKKRHPFA